MKIKENEKERDKYLDLARGLKKLWVVKLTSIPIITGALGTIPKGLVKGLKELKIKYQPRPFKYSIIEIGYNTEKSPGNLKKLVVT